MSLNGTVIAAFDWTPIGLLLTFIASMSGVLTVYFKGRADNKQLRHERELEQFNATEAKKVIQTNEMATIAFQSLEGQYKHCEQRCERLEQDNRDLRRTVSLQSAKINRQEDQLDEQKIEIRQLRRLVEGTP